MAEAGTAPAFTASQVLALAPDTATAAAGRKLATPQPWKHLGRSERAVWGECQGSALYQVRGDLSDLAVKCSCPSRKFPCKHGLGLLLLVADDLSSLAPATPPDWVEAWLARRQLPAVARRDKGAGAVSEPHGQVQRMERRLQQVRQGAEGLERWLRDLIRTGLAGLELQPVTFWEAQAARLVDAQAPGLAGRVRRLAALPNATPDWPERLLAQLGKLALLLHAFGRLDHLNPPLQEDVRQAIGWSLSQEEVLTRGEVVRDEWAVLGQRVSEEERLRVQRTWLRGECSGRDALAVQFSAAGAPFEPTFLPGTRLDAELVFWPSAAPQRAMLKARHGRALPIGDRLPGAGSFTEHLERVAAQLARQPWLERFPCALRDVIPLRAGDGRWWLSAEGEALPLTPGEHWVLLALSGGRPLDLAGEWYGELVHPIAVVVDARYHHLREAG